VTARPKIVAINGSERDGNTAHVLRYAAKIAEARGVDFDTVDLRTIRMGPCGPCGDCNRRTVPCVVDDDVPAVVERMSAADGVIYATPVHGFAAGALMQTFIERSGVGYLRFTRPLTNKVGGAIVLARRYSASVAYQHLLMNLLLNRMILVGSGFPAEVHALHVGEAAEDEEGLIHVRRMVDRMIDMIEFLREYRALGGREDALTPRERNERLGLPVENFADEVVDNVHG